MALERKPLGDYIMSRIIKEVVASFPAYDVIKPRKCSLTGLPVFKDNDVVAVSGSRNYKMLTFGSVISYAIENNDDPIESYNDAVERGHDLHWLNKNCVSITSNNEAKETYLELNIGDEILFQGIVFRIDTYWDKSPKLVKVGTKEGYTLI
jgi:hypothetical protein